MNETNDAGETITETMTEPNDAKDPRQIFFRDAVVFHGKLVLDGLRDFVLFPVSLVAALVDVLKRDDPPGRRFYDVIHFGRETENWIGLFDAADRVPEGDRRRPTIDGPKLDDFIDDLGQKLKDEHERGELSAAAKQKLEQMLEAARKAMARGRR